MEVTTGNCKEPVLVKFMVLFEQEICIFMGASVDLSSSVAGALNDLLRLLQAPGD